MGFDKPALILHGKKRRTVALSGLYRLHSHRSAGARSAPSSHVLQRAVVGVTFPSLICPYITLSSCQTQGGEEVCVQEVAFQSPSSCDMWKGSRGLVSGPGQESRSRLLQRVGVCFFQKRKRGRSH